MTMIQDIRAEISEIKNILTMSLKRLKSRIYLKTQINDKKN